MLFFISIILLLFPSPYRQRVGLLLQQRVALDGPGQPGLHDGEDRDRGHHGQARRGGHDGTGVVVKVLISLFFHALPCALSRPSAGTVLLTDGKRLSRWTRRKERGV